MSQSLSDKFFDALRRRGFTPARAARICGTSRDTFERLASGVTSKVNGAWIRDICAVLTAADRIAFLREIGIVEREARPAPQAEPPAEIGGWFGQDGEFHPAPAGLSSIVPAMAPRPPADAAAWEDEACAAGWAGVEVTPTGEIALVCHRDQSSIAALEGLADLLAGWNAWRVRFDERSRTAPIDTTLDEARARLLRIVRSRTPLPAGWIDRSVELGELDIELRRLLETRISQNTAQALPWLLDHGRASLFAIEDGEAICLHIGRLFDVPTRDQVGKRVLDRPTFPAFSAIVDRHAVTTAQLGRPRGFKVAAAFDTHRVEYDKLALPFRMDGRQFVVTTSIVTRTQTATVLEGTVSATARPPA